MKDIQLDTASCWGPLQGPSSSCAWGRPYPPPHPWYITGEPLTYALLIMLGWGGEHAERWAEAISGIVLPLL